MYYVIHAEHDTPYVYKNVSGAYYEWLELEFHFDHPNDPFWFATYGRPYFLQYNQDHQVFDSLEKLLEAGILSEKYTRALLQLEI